MISQMFGCSTNWDSKYADHWCYSRHLDQHPSSGKSSFHLEEDRTRRSRATQYLSQSGSPRHISQLYQSRSLSSTLLECSSRRHFLSPGIGKLVSLGYLALSSQRKAEEFWKWLAESARYHLVLYLYLKYPRRKIVFRLLSPCSGNSLYLLFPQASRLRWISETLPQNGLFQCSSSQRFSECSRVHS